MLVFLHDEHENVGGNMGVLIKFPTDRIIWPVSEPVVRVRRNGESRNVLHDSVCAP